MCRKLNVQESATLLLFNFLYSRSWSFAKSASQSPVYFSFSLFFFFFGFLGGLACTTSSASSSGCSWWWRFLCFFLCRLPVTSSSAGGETTASTVVTVAVGPRFALFLGGLTTSSTSSSVCWWSSRSISESSLLRVDGRRCEPLLVKDDLGIEVLRYKVGEGSSSSSSSTSSCSWTARVQRWPPSSRDRVAEGGRWPCLGRLGLVGGSGLSSSGPGNDTARRVREFVRLVD